MVASRGDDARSKAMLWMFGWRTAAAFLTIPKDVGNDPIFLDGWAAGRLARQEASTQAEKKFGYTFIKINVRDIT